MDTGDVVGFQAELVAFFKFSMACQLVKGCLPLLQQV